MGSFQASQDAISARLVVEEFIQMHQHLRQREEAMNQLLNLTATGTTTLMAAIAAFVFQAASASPERISIWHCYLFLLPIPLVIFGLSMLAAHRDDIFKMGYYIKVFFENKLGGAAWGTRLESLRDLGESQDAALLVLWSLFVIAASLFMIGLHLVGDRSPLHLLSLLPFLVWMVIQHFRFMRNRRYIEHAWLKVRKQEQDASSTD